MGSRTVPPSDPLRDGHRAGPRGPLDVRKPFGLREDPSRRAVSQASGTMRLVWWRDRPVALRRADTNQIDDVLVVLNEAAERLAVAGVQQWPRRFEPQWVSPAIEQGHTWLIYVDVQLAATLTLGWSDPLWNGDDGAAGYLHRLAVRRLAAGLGSHLLGWAAGEVDRHNRELLRLDCVAGNRRLRDYYGSNGFQHRGDVEVGGAPGQRDDAAARILVSRYELHVQPQVRPSCRNTIG